MVSRHLPIARAVVCLTLAGCRGCRDHDDELPSPDLAELAGCEELTLYLDEDGDGHGDPAAAVSACVAPETAVEDPLDCDDADPAIHPGAFATCADGVDNDCDASPDCAGIRDRTGVDEASAVLVDQWESAAGASLAIADLTGDGVNDLLIGAPSAEEGAYRGRTYLVTGPVFGFIDLTSDDVPDISSDAINQDGLILTTGDLDGDGYDDLEISGESDEREENAVYIVPGPVTEDYEVDRDGAIYLDLDYSATGYYRDAMVNTGDVLGADGFTDLLVDSGRANDGAGSVFLVPGPISGDGSIFDLAETALYGVWEDGEVVPLASANVVGDIDGDGVHDVAGAVGSDYLYVVTESPPGLYDMADLAAVTIYADREAPGDRFMSPGDMDGDGLDELVTSTISPDEVYFGSTDIVYLFSGEILNSASEGEMLDIAQATATFVGSDKSQIGIGMASPGDLNEDGFSDIFLGDPRCASGEDYEYPGLAALWYGPVEGTLATGSAEIVIEGDTVGSRTGWRVAGSPRDAMNNAILLVGAWPINGATTLYQFTPDGY